MPYQWKEFSIFFQIPKHKILIFHYHLSSHYWSTLLKGSFFFSSSRGLSRSFWLLSGSFCCLSRHAVLFSPTLMDSSKSSSFVSGVSVSFCFAQHWQYYSRRLLALNLRYGILIIFSHNAIWNARHNVLLLQGRVMSEEPSSIARRTAQPLKDLLHHQPNKNWLKKDRRMILPIYCTTSRNG